MSVNLGGRPRQFDEEEALDRIMASFRKHGYENTTFEQLVADSGLSRSSLYSTFGGKKELLKKSLQRFIETEVDDLLAMLSDEASAPDAFRMLIGNFSKPTTECLVRKTMLKNATAAEKPLQVSTIRSCLNKLWGGITQALTQIRGSGNASKKTPELSNEERAAILVGLIHGSGVIVRNGKNTDLLENIQSGAAKLLMC